jgi:hypothetical protein
VREEKDNPRESGSPKQARDDLLKPREHSVEVTGLGVAAAESKRLGFQPIYQTSSSVYRFPVSDFPVGRIGFSST